MTEQKIILLPREEDISRNINSNDLTLRPIFYSGHGEWPKGLIAIYIVHTHIVTVKHIFVGRR